MLDKLHNINLKSISKTIRKSYLKHSNLWLLIEIGVIGFLIRLIPELRTSFVTGWDTIAYVDDLAHWGQQYRSSHSS